MKKLILSLILSAGCMVACTNNQSTTDNHGHEHGENGEHADQENQEDHGHDHGNDSDHGHDHEGDHHQEEFTIEDDSLSND